MSQAIVAIVGAPNVGKSTLFNRLLGHRRAIVSDHPGVTRDRIAAECDLSGLTVTLVDTGGVVAGSADVLTRAVRGEALKAVAEADLILFMVDARAGVTATDQEVAVLLRTSGKPIVPLANKIDSISLQGLEAEVYRLGLGDVVSTSAEHGLGMDDLVDRIQQALPDRQAAVQPPGVPLAVIGRPNVGKSSLFNRLVRHDRSLVSVEPGTTRDPVDAVFECGGTMYRLIDTAGIRRHARTGGDIEQVSVLKARRALAEAAIAIAMVDAAEAVTHQDLALVGLVARSHKPALLAANKIDLVRQRGGSITQHLGAIRTALRFSTYVPVVPMSALTGSGVSELLSALQRLRVESSRRFPTAELNRILEQVVREKHPPSDRGREVRFYYMTQTGGPPPRLVIFGNGRKVGPTYRRFLEGRFRTHLGLSSCPVVLNFRQSEGSR